MKRTERRIRGAWVVGLAVMLELLGCAGGAGRDGTRSGAGALLALVGDTSISRGDLERRILERYYGKRALLGLVREALFLHEARRLGVTVSSAEVETLVKQELETDTEGLSEGLAQLGLDLDDVADELRFEIRNGLLIERVVRAQRRVGEREIQQYYERTYRRRRVALRHIAFPFGQRRSPIETVVEETRVRAQRVAEEIAAGGDFAELARSRSGNPETARRGGFLGLVDEEVLGDDQLSSVIFGLEVGAVSEPIREGDYGFHLFRVERRVEPQPLDAVRDELKRELLEAPPSSAEISAVERLLRERIPVTVFAESL